MVNGNDSKGNVKFLVWVFMGLAFIAGWFYILKPIPARVEDHEKRMICVEKDVAKQDDDIKEIKAELKEQSIKQDRILNGIDKLNEKIK